MLLYTSATSCNFRFGYSCLLFLTQPQMPKYAVAVGRKVGIYDTYDECKLHVMNYPNAKFKKFNTQQEAEEYIQKIKNTPTVNMTVNSNNTTTTFKKENMFKPELIKVDKVSSDTSLSGLNNRICIIEQRLNSFITSTSELLDGISSRINLLEGDLKRSATTSAIDCSPARKKKKQDKLDVGNFKCNDLGFVEVYTDGACSKNGKMGAKAGIGVWFNEDHPLNVSAPVIGPATNNNAEIQAARIAITQAARAGLKKITVYTDSQFLINCITQWIHKWKKNDWKLSTGGNVKNKDELVKLDKAIQSVDAVEWIHVQGHRGVLGNERADCLARNGAAKYKTNVTYSANVEDLE